MLRLRGSSEGPSFSRTPKTRHLADAHMHTHCALPMHGPAPVPGIIARCCCALAASWAGYNWEQGVRCPVKLLRLVRPWTSTAYEGLGSSGWAFFFHSRRAITGPCIARPVLPGRKAIRVVLVWGAWVRSRPQSGAAGLARLPSRPVVWIGPGTSCQLGPPTRLGPRAPPEHARAGEAAVCVAMAGGRGALRGCGGWREGAGCFCLLL